MNAPHHSVRRVLMTADTIGGVWTYALELMSALRPPGIRFALATMGRPLSAAQRAVLEELDHVELHESEFKLEWMDAPWSDVDAAGDWLLKIADEFEPDLIHLNGYAHATLPWRRPILVVAHSCVYSWFAAVKGAPPPVAEWLTYRERISHGLRAATLVTAPSKAMLGELERFYEGPFRTAPPVYNGRNARLFGPGEKQEFILTAGRLWDEAKNVGILSEIANEVGWPMRVAGEIHRPNGSQTVFSGLHQLGFLDGIQFADQLSHASIYALPARYEPFGLSALEAALSGCALVLGDIPSLREVWADAALFVSPNDPTAWRDALNRLARDAALRSDLSSRAHNRSRGYSLERMAQGYLQIYRELPSACLDHENRSFLPLAPVRLEPRKRALPTRIRHRTH